MLPKSNASRGNVEIPCPAPETAEISAPNLVIGASAERGWAMLSRPLGPVSATCGDYSIFTFDCEAASTCGGVVARPAILRPAGCFA